MRAKLRGGELMAGEKRGAGPGGGKTLDTGAESFSPYKQSLDAAGVSYGAADPGQDIERRRQGDLDRHASKGGRQNAGGDREGDTETIYPCG